MSTGNAHQSKWSAEFHSTRPSMPRPVPDGCGGDCRVIHPRGIVLLASGGWEPMPAFNPDDLVPGTKEGD